MTQGRKSKTGLVIGCALAMLAAVAAFAPAFAGAQAAADEYELGDLPNPDNDEASQTQSNEDEGAIAPTSSGSDSGTPTPPAGGEVDTTGAVVDDGAAQRPRQGKPRRGRLRRTAQRRERASYAARLGREPRRGPCGRRRSLRRRGRARAPDPARDRRRGLHRRRDLAPAPLDRRVGHRVGHGRRPQRQDSRDAIALMRSRGTALLAATLSALAFTAGVAAAKPIFGVVPQDGGAAHDRGPGADAPRRDRRRPPDGELELGRDHPRHL